MSLNAVGNGANRRRPLVPAPARSNRRRLCDGRADESPTATRPAQEQHQRHGRTTPIAATTPRATGDATLRLGLIAYRASKNQNAPMPLSHQTSAIQIHARRMNP